MGTTVFEENPSTVYQYISYLSQKSGSNRDVLYRSSPTSAMLEFSNHPYTVDELIENHYQGLNASDFLKGCFMNGGALDYTDVDETFFQFLTDKGFVWE